ncbi:MAG: hypothetical protein KGJ07_05970 [Patescibacteria group bacterium]|nr:hypothetical protein [Patescibacteria group bacterium]
MSELHRNVIVVEFENGEYANGIIGDGHIITANHVAQGARRVIAPQNGLHIDVSPSTFEHIMDPHLTDAQYPSDIARSFSSIGEVGFSHAGKATKGEAVTMVGFHGPKRRPFTIRGTVEGLEGRGYLAVSVDEGEQDLELGMSGIPVLRGDTVLGILHGDGGSRRRGLFMPTKR